MITVLGWVLAAAVVVNLAVFVLLLASSRRSRGGNIDLTPAAARGELDVTWDWPGSRPRRKPLAPPLDASNRRT